ncbi:hypothetical protein GCM10007935_36990 [Hydrogenophaga electricum]|uniref:DUF1653 domain-containing protein n=1 Tax=Hydrogenophaga electricum TaxID=1230953 RepID=A0ABQ6CC52_9BURK|nr:hypothetical protein GCM10007935_36990 [Hydrogenophaga electricum]
MSASDTDLPPLLPTPPGLYRHYKGGWYEVLDTVRCSETLQGMTLYRALYGGFGLWVRPAAMFGESGVFEGRAQPRFVRRDPAGLLLADLPTARAVVAHLRAQAHQRGLDLDTALRRPPPEPTTCCGRGCNGCVWEGFYTAIHHWRDDACALLTAHGDRAGHAAAAA